LAFAIRKLRIRQEALTATAAPPSDELLELITKVSKGGTWNLVLESGQHLDDHGGQIFISPALKALIGFADDEFPNSIRDWQERIIPDDLELVRRTVKEIFEGKKDLHEVEYRIRHKDGGVRRIRSCAVVQRDELGRPIRLSGIDWDITERALADEEHRRLITVIEQAATAVIITDRRGRIEYVNPEFGQVSGFSREEVIGYNLDIFRNEKQSEEFYQEIRDTLSAGKIWAGRYTIRTKPGPFRVFDTTISPVFDRMGNIINYVCVNRDATHEVALETQLRQAQKFEALGTLAAGIAHDFNNILGGIIGYTELVMCQLQEGEQAMADLEQVVKACYRARELVKQVLVFSRKDDQGKQPVNVTVVVKEALRMLRASLPTTIRIVSRLLADSTTVLADPTQIHQVLVNLFTNSAHAVDETNGIVEVSLTDVFIEKEDLVFFPELSEGSYLKIEVSDNGHGIRPEDLERIFDPYFSTKQKDEGTGLGLAVVRGIVESHKGTIRVQSKLGAGATFSIFLPVIDEESKPEFDAPMAMPPGTERVLLVDDEPTLVQLCKNMLVRLGYEVETANGGIEALEKFLAGPDRFDLVITDYTMPYLTGEGLAQQIMEIRPDLPIVMCTGYSKRIDEVRAKTLGIRQFIMKPVAMRELARAVRAALEDK
jgi:PAS domain S-box-containing protein